MPSGMGKSGNIREDIRTMINSAVRKKNKPCWFVMRCREKERIEAFIKEYNADREVPQEEKIEDYFIPSAVLHQHVGLAFLYVRPSAFDQRDNSSFFRYRNAGKTRMFLYTDGKGEAITVRPEKMRVFINGCLEYLERFEVHAKDEEIVDGIEVTVRRGTFKDYKAEVYNVRSKACGIRFSIAIKFFANDRYVHIHDLSPEDVQLADKEVSLFDDDFIDRIQSTLLEVLGRRVNKKETAETREADARRMQQLYILRHAVIDDALRAAQFDALMSICASLMGNPQEKRKYNRIVKERLKGLENLTQNENEKTIAEAYLLTALYISTKDAEYRTRLKEIVLRKLPEHKALRAFLSLIRKK